MSETALEPAALANLTDKELEALRLLAAGHTAKTIAAQLGRSEASVNERLRDARRKTGIGSSRELARIVAAQKTWDRNIDLSKPDAPADVQPQPATGGSHRSKGIAVMIIAASAAALGLALAQAPSMEAVPSAASHAATSGPSPLSGEWSLDVSRIPEAERPRQVTIAFREADDGKWTTRVAIVAPDGSTMQADSTGAADGTPFRIAGNIPSFNTVALRHPSPDTLVMTLGMDNAPVSTRVYTVSKDRKSMTETIIWAAQGLPRLETTYFNRIG